MKHSDEHQGEEVPARNVSVMPCPDCLGSGEGLPQDDYCLRCGGSGEMVPTAEAAGDGGFIRCPFCNYILPPGSRIGEA